jgi:hypothetical protein
MTVVLLAIACACLGLSACGSTSDPVKETAARDARLASDQHAEAMDLVNCAHRHGIDLPEPDAQDKISTRGVNLEGPRRKAAINTCYHKAVATAERVYAAERARAGESSKPPAAAAPAQAQTQATEVSASERRQLVEVVSCARRHGIDLPEPNAQNKISTRGVDVKGRRREATLSACVREVADRASSEQG